MKSVAVLACLLASAHAFGSFGTRAVGKAPAAPAVPEVTSDIGDGSYPSIAEKASSWKPFTNVSGGGNKGPPTWWTVPDFSDPALQIERDPEFYAEAAKSRLSKASEEFVIDDGLTELERRQRGTVMSTFLTGSAKSQIDTTSIREDIVVDEFAFGLSADRFQLLFISVFGLFTLVGCLSGSVKL
eukprot:CAMPEP_0113537564 /NCGR_PEP_ID=MMETSP0015_2-20120614/6893_1 /TAXON_ID=2838 /ORGANISM="Odontella" /LENGTH=184 /DNA_ID=CAMNT_0000437067 /DNA_START=55 /DNA_END=609 /DNA_ORIENTATION=+ /assembly_acc=CAM_ASM_000160